ncbi:MAG: hypothetical protein Q8O28_07450 [Smithellaceae bacterium]|nr:hypothetical protein [Smithellaceae bacterium]
MTKIIQCIFESIWIRILFINAIAVFIGIRSNALITNITRAGGTDWSLMWGSRDFKAIAVAFVSVVSYQVIGGYLDSRKQRRVEAKIDQILANTMPMPLPSQISPAPTNVAPVQSPKRPIRVSTVFQATFDQLSDAEKTTVRTMVSRLQKNGLKHFLSQPFVHKVSARGQSMYVLRLGKDRILFSINRENHDDSVLLHAFMSDEIVWEHAKVNVHGEK